MKSFNEWTRQKQKEYSEYKGNQAVIGVDPAKPGSDKTVVAEMLPDGVWQCIETSEYLATCIACQRSMIVDDLELFSEDYAYCNSTPFCSP